MLARPATACTCDRFSAEFEGPTTDQCTLLGHPHFDTISGFEAIVKAGSEPAQRFISFSHRAVVCAFR